MNTSVIKKFVCKTYVREILVLKLKKDNFTQQFTQHALL